MFATMYKGLLFESDISFEEMTRPGSLCNTVKMSSTGLTESIKVNNSLENFNKNLFDVVKDKKLTQLALLEIQGETKIIQEVK